MVVLLLQTLVSEAWMFLSVWVSKEDVACTGEDGVSVIALPMVVLNLPGIDSLTFLAVSTSGTHKESQTSQDEEVWRTGPVFYYWLLLLFSKWNQSSMDEIRALIGSSTSQLIQAQDGGLAL